MVEKELDAMISRRDEKRRKKSEGERLEAELWIHSCRAYAKSKQEQAWWERLRYHEAQVKCLSVTIEVLITGHRREVARYEALLGISTNGHHEKGD
jgi:hypothetical protein